MNPENKHFRFVLALFHALALLTTLSCSNQQEEKAADPKVEKSSELSLQKVDNAHKANKNHEKMLAVKEAIEQYLSAKLAREVEVLIPTDSSVVVESFRNGT